MTDAARGTNATLRRLHRNTAIHGSPAARDFGSTAHTTCRMDYPHLPPKRLRVRTTLDQATQQQRVKERFRLNR